MRNVVTSSYGIKFPAKIDNLENSNQLIDLIIERVLLASKTDGFRVNRNSIIAVTESLLARAQKNFALTSDIGIDIDEHFNGKKIIGVVFPIFSRNRFQPVLEGIASSSAEEIIVQLSYPSDEVGNPLGDKEELERIMKKYNINPYTDIFTEERFRTIFGYDVTKHPITGIDYIELYKAVSPKIKIIFSNDPVAILRLTSDVIAADIHTRFETRNTIYASGGNVITLDRILAKGINGRGYNPDYGVLGSNCSKSGVLKLFPRDAINFVYKLQAKFMVETGIFVESLVYGDGAFKDPVNGIWELADPVVAPGYTSGLTDNPCELKFKMLSDSNMTSDQIKREIRDKKQGVSQLGTTPRRIRDLVGSLCDLTSGSGDKGTPVVLVNGYFDNFTTEENPKRAVMGTHPLIGRSGLTF